MGRVSKHKKIKSFDPFYKGPRRIDSCSDNLAPANEDDQPVPKSLIRLMKSASRHTKHASKQGVQQKQSTSGRSSVETSTKETDEGVMFKRRRGESLKSYLERIDAESNERIMEAHRKNRKMSERRKRYLNERKKRLKIRKGGDSDTSTNVVEFKDFKDVVQFGEVAHAPPQLSAKPRGTQKKSKGERIHSLLLQQSLDSKKLSNDAKENPLPVVIGLKRKHDLEIERERAVEMYRQSKRTKMSRINDKGID